MKKQIFWKKKIIWKKEIVCLEKKTIYRQKYIYSLQIIDFLKKFSWKKIQVNSFKNIDFFPCLKMSERVHNSFAFHEKKCLSFSANSGNPALIPLVYSELDREQTFVEHLAFWNPFNIYAWKTIKAACNLNVFRVETSHNFPSILTSCS